MPSSVYHLLTHSTVIEEDDDTTVPVQIWYEIYLWLDRLGLDLEAQEKFFWNDDILVLVQMYRGELRYAFGGRPRSWLWFDEL